MTASELERRFEHEIDRRGVDDKYIDGLEERELLQIGLQHGFSTDEARRFLLEACAHKGYVIEAAVAQHIREALRRRLDSRGRLDRAAFDAILNETRPLLARTTRTEADLRRLAATVIDDSGIARIRTGWFGNWFAQVLRDCGVR